MMKDAPLSLFKRSVLIGILCYLTGAIFQLWFFGPPETFKHLGGAIDSAFMRLFSYSMYGTAVVLMIIALPRMLGSMRHALTGWVMLFYITLSTLWSLDADGSMDVAKILLISFAFGSYLALKVSAQNTLRIFALFYAIVMLAGLFFIVRYPYLGTYAIDGSWRGAFGDRNEMAFHACLALSVWIAQWKLTSQRWKKCTILAPLIILTAGMIVFSGSATGLVCMMVIVLSIPLFYMLYAKPGRLVVMLPLMVLVTVFASTIVSNYRADILRALGKDETLTGRTIIWEEFLKAAEKSPLLGYGAQPIFVRSGEVLTTTFYDSALQQSYAYAPHSVYVAIMIKYGAVGLLLFAAMMITILRRILALKEDEAPATSLAKFMMLTVIIVFGFSLTIDALAIVWIYLGMVLASPPGASAKRMPSARYLMPASSPDQGSAISSQ